LLAFAIMTACERGAPSDRPAGERLAFEDVTAQSGITFVHRHGGTGRKLFPETMGSGCALFDFDGDGDLDLYFVNGPGAPNALYENDGHARFRDVTEHAGVGDRGFGMGAVAADIDNDGDLDLFVTNYGGKVLYANDGDGTFTDVTRRAGFAGDGRWATSAAFADVDNDGFVDLYVCHYVRYDIEHPPDCRSPDGMREYCNPADFPSEPDALYHNRGDGTFIDVTEQAGIVDPEGRGLGVVFFDLDDDGDQDIFVANDMSRNYLFVNRGDGTFDERGLIAGVAYNEGGRVSAGMGTDAGDYDNDGRLDLFVVNFSLETNTLFHNEGGGTFTDRTVQAGLAPITLRWLGFGTLFFDPDLDGDLDLVTVNGHVLDTIERHGQGVTYAEPAQLLENLGDGRFREASSTSGPYFSTPHVGRGLACGDLDGDGDEDLVISNCNQAAALLLNRQATGNATLAITLVGHKSNRSAIGARVTVTANGQRQIREVKCGYSYLSQGSLTQHFGLGSAKVAERIEVRWPAGTRQVFEEVAVPAGLVIDELSGSKSKN
jgi:hypothetical protein